MTTHPAITIVDYGMGNLSSVRNAFRHLGWAAECVNQPDAIAAASVVVLPGVGAFGRAMENLRALQLIEPLRRKVLEERVPFLGICLGMQLIARSSEENGQHEGLGWLDAHVRRLPVTSALRLPHVGWNDVQWRADAPLFSGVGEDKNFYFVHSYHVECDPQYIDATCVYGAPVTAAIRKENIVATQFHPEKSHVNGMTVLRNFLREVSGGATC